MAKNPRNSNSNSRMYLLNHLPDYLIWNVFEFSVGKGSDLLTLSLLSESERNVLGDMASDGNSVVWELLFKSRNQLIHGAMVQAKDSRSSWQTRVVAHMATQQGQQPQNIAPLRRAGKLLNPLGWMTSKVFWEQGLPSLMPTSFDLYFYNHPEHGLQVNIGKLNRAVFCYAVRRHLHQSHKSVAEVVLEPFNLPVQDEHQAVGVHTGRPPLVLMNIDGRDISSFDSYGDVLKFVGKRKEEADFSCWRFLLPDQCTWRVRQGAFMFSSACLLPKPEEEEV